MSASADAFFAVSLAGSLFFNVSVDAARPRVILYLALTMAPFAIVAPLIGPLVDRYSRARTSVIALTLLVRGILCLFIAGDLKSLFFYPEAFGVLVLGKGYSIAKSTAVPGLVNDPGGLVAANSRLSRLSSVAGAGAGAAAVGVLHLGGAPLVLRLGSLVYFAGAALAVRIPPVDEPVGPQLDQAEAEVHTRPVILGASAVTTFRASIGFLTFLIAFGFRQASEPVWLYGAALAALGVGNFAATILTPAIRRRWLREEQLFAAALLLASVATLYSAWRVGRVSVLVASFAVGLGANVGRQAFDSILQRDAPDAARGRFFARFETRFQLAWVVGALVPVVFQSSTRAGLTVLGTVFAVALAACLAGVSIEASLARRLWSVLGRLGETRAPR
ncbi:MAG TPA: MFS transporter [Acidimicrobiales bacterium]|nr:MFS transporter [Acidimicrobiales bacterium]